MKKETDGNQVTTQSSGHNRGSEALKNSSSLCSSCPALAAEIAHGHLCDAQAERITALEAEIERLSKDKDAIALECLDQRTRALTAEARVTELQEQLLRQVWDVVLQGDDFEPVRDEFGAIHVDSTSQRMHERLVAAIKQQIISRDWQPIETAPKDRRVLLRCQFEEGNTYEVQPGIYDDDYKGNPPSPFWRYDCDASGHAAYSREHLPTHWMPLPSPPSEARRLLQLEDQS